MMRILSVLPLLVLFAVPAMADDYTYDPIGKRDPFRDPTHLGPPPPPPPAVLSVFMQYELSQLTLVAVAGNDDVRYAMVEPPVGPGALLMPGTRLGSRAAIVIEIGPTHVVAREERRLVDGTLLVHDHTLRLAESVVWLPIPAPGP